MSPIVNDGCLYGGDMPTRTGKRIDLRSYSLMPMPKNVSIDYLAGMEAAIRFVLSTDLQAVPLSASEALDRVVEMQEAIIESMEVEE